MGGRVVSYPTIPGGGGGTVTTSGRVDGDGSGGDPVTLTAATDTLLTDSAALLARNPLASGQTAGATTATILTVAIPASSVVTIIGWGNGHDTALASDNGLWNYLAQIQRVGSAAPTVVFDNGQGPLGPSGIPGATLSTAISGNNALIQATGVAGKTINWVYSPSVVVNPS